MLGHAETMRGALDSPSPSTYRPAGALIGLGMRTTKKSQTIDFVVIDETGFDYQAFTLSSQLPFVS